jgi:hypothetical protein
MGSQDILDAEYLRAISLVEALTENQPGSDKTWVYRMHEAFREHCRRSQWPTDPHKSIAQTLDDHHRRALEALADPDERQSS